MSDTLKDLVKSFMQRLPELDDPDMPLQGSEAVEVLAEYWPLFKEALKQQAVKKRRNSARTRYFASETEVVGYIGSEIVATLQDDYDRMTHDKYERQHYTNDDRQTMRDKLHDVRAVVNRLTLFDAEQKGR